MKQTDPNTPPAFDADFSDFEVDLNSEFPSHFNYTEGNIDILFQQVGKLTGKSGLFTQEELFQLAGLDWSKQKISNWLSGNLKRTNIRELEFRRLCDFIEGEKLWDTQKVSKAALDQPDVFYHAAVDFFGVKHGTEINIVDRVPGIFRLYQPSMMFHDRIVIGYTKIWYSRESNAVKVYERQYYDGDRNSRSMTEIYEGYMYRKAKRYFIIQRDKSRNFSKFTILPNWWRSGEKIDFFSGVTMGLHGSRVYTFRVYLERFDGTEEEISEHIGIKPKSEVPANVLHSLEMPFLNGISAFF
jgi:hypothetical protein